MNLRFVTSLLLLMAFAGCHAACRMAPGPAFVERRPPVGDSGVARRPFELGLDTEPLTPLRRKHPDIGRLRGSGSFSIGTPTRGILFNGRQLPLQGVSHKVMAEQSGRGTNWASDELVESLLKAADDVARRFPGSILPVGNLSRGGGGRIRWSISHQSGRDADVGFYLRQSDGTQIFQQAMVKIAPDGSTLLPDGTVAYLDVPRTWTFIKSMLRNRRISLQWVFLADPIRLKLLEYAAARKEAPSLIEMAGQVMAQPAGLPHDDHMHIRTYCRPDDLLEGCRDIGSNRPWYASPGPRVAKRLKELVRLSRSGDAAVRRDAVTVLGHFSDSSAVRYVVARLRDEDPDVRRAAVSALEWLGIRGFERQVAAAIVDPDTPDDVADRLLTLVETKTPTRSATAVLEALCAVSRELTVDNGVFVSTTVVSERARQRLGLPEDRERFTSGERVNDVTLTPSGG